MPAGSSFTNAFTGAAVKPSQVSYLALSISTTAALFWPTETLEGVPYVATQLDVTATAGGLQLQMPNAMAGSLGQATVITNVGSNTFTLTDTSGNSIAPIAAGVSWLISLTTNTTANGTWRALQLASTTSAATAASLAGAGLQANGSLLQLTIATTTLSINSTIVSANRAQLINWTGGAGTLQLDTIANLRVGWFCAIVNNGTGNLSLSTTGGQTINYAAPPVTIIPGAWLFVFCDAANFNALGPDGGTTSAPIFHHFAYTSSTTFVAPGTVDTIYKITGTGGGGGGAPSLSTVTLGNAGSGGGSGASFIYYLTGIAPGSSVVITIGAGGLGSFPTPTNGGDTTVVSGAFTLTAGGGKKGINSRQYAAASNGAPGGAGGVATNGTINMAGSPGGVSIGIVTVATGAVNNAWSGNGGASIWGGGGVGGYAYSNIDYTGTAGGSPGAGGGGSGTPDANLTNIVGGNGVAGIVTIEATY